MGILASTRLSMVKAEIHTMELRNVIRVYGMDVKFIITGKTALSEA
jgi:hypothetical protein